MNDPISGLSPRPRRSRTCLLLLAATTATFLTACSDGASPSEEATSISQHIYSGNSVEGDLVGVVYIEYKDGFGDICSSGSGVMLTNTWLLSAAHVLDHQCAFPPVELKITMRGSSLIQTLTFQAGNFPFVFIHPKYKFDPSGSTATLNHGWDAALMKLDQPFMINGSNAGHVRKLTPKPASDFILAGKKSVYGCSVTAPPASWPPAPSALGVPATADFTVVPFPGISLNLQKIPQLLQKGPSPHELAVLRGGGFLPSANVADAITVPGDSGGPMIDIVDPIFLGGDIIGIVESGDPEKNAFGVPTPEFAYFSAASGFRDYVRAVLAYNAPRLVVDVNGDGQQDSIGMAPSAFGTAVFDIQFGGGGGFSWDTGIPLPDGSLAALFPGNFDGDTFEDVVGHIAGQPLYFRGASTFDFVSNVSTSWSLIGNPNLTNPIAYLTVDDFNFDGTSDVEVVRETGDATIFLGDASGTKGLTTASHLVPRGFNFFGDPEESFAIASPGANPRLDLPGGISPSQGAVYLWSNDGTSAYLDQISLFGLKTALGAGPGGEPGDQFGATLSWGAFDGSATEHALVVGAPGRSVSNLDDAGVVAYLRFNPASAALVSATYFDATTFGSIAAEGARFGDAIAAGDFNGDTLDDVAIGSNGAVHVLMGNSTSGLAASGTKLTLMPTSFSVTSTGFGRALAAGDFNCDGFEDLAVGVSGATVNGTPRAGAVIVNYGGPSGLVIPSANNVARWQRLDQSITGIGSGVLEDGQQFGYELVAGNFNGDAFQGRPCIDIAISSEPMGSVLSLPGFPPAFMGRGAIDVVYGSSAGFTPTGSQRLAQGLSLGGQLHRRSLALTVPTV